MQKGRHVTRRAGEQGFATVAAAQATATVAMVCAVVANIPGAWIVAAAAAGVVVVAAMAGLAAYRARSRRQPTTAAPLPATTFDSSLLAEQRHMAGLVSQQLANVTGATRCDVYSLEDGEIRWIAGTANRPLQPWLTFEGARDLREALVLDRGDARVNRAALRAAGVRTILALPLPGAQGITAVACLPVVARRFGERQCREAACAAELAALAMATGGLYGRQSGLAEELRQRSLVVEALLQLGNDLRAVYKLDDVFDRVGSAVIDALGYNETAIYLYDEATDAMVTRSILGGAPALNDVYLSNPIPMRVMRNFLLQEYRVGSSYYRSQVRAPNTAEEESYMPSTDLGERPAEEWQSGDCLLVPMVTRDKGLLGLIDAYDPRDRRPPTAEGVRILEIFANLAAVAIENATQYETLQTQGERLERQIRAHEHLLKVSESMLTTLDQEVVFSAIDDQLRLLLDYDTLCIDRVDWTTRSLTPIYVRDETYGDAILNMPLAIGEGLGGWVAEHNEAILVNDVLSDHRGAVIPGTDADEPQASIVVPLTVQNSVLGVLTIDRLGGRIFDEEDFDLVKVFASQAAIAIQNADLYDEIQQRAITDSLTGLYNHGHFQETLAREIARCERYGEVFALVMLDLDHFKLVNDCFGHPTGDRVLRRVAEAILRCSREADYAARYGGEEFVLLLPRTTREEACSLAERVRAEIGAIDVDRGAYHLAASLGVADFPACATSAAGLIAAADAALLWAKRHGRDRVDYFGALADAS